MPTQKFQWHPLEGRVKHVSRGTPAPSASTHDAASRHCSPAATSGGSEVGRVTRRYPPQDTCGSLMSFTTEVSSSAALWVHMYVFGGTHRRTPVATLVSSVMKMVNRKATTMSMKKCSAVDTAIVTLRCTCGTAESESNLESQSGLDVLSKKCSTVITAIVTLRCTCSIARVCGQSLCSNAADRICSMAALEDRPRVLGVPVTRVWEHPGRSDRICFQRSRKPGSRYSNSTCLLEEDELADPQADDHEDKRDHDRHPGGDCVRAVGVGDRGIVYGKGANAWMDGPCNLYAKKARRRLS